MQEHERRSISGKENRRMTAADAEGEEMSTQIERMPDFPLLSRLILSAIIGIIVSCTGAVPANLCHHHDHS